MVLRREACAASGLPESAGLRRTHSGRTCARRLAANRSPPPTPTPHGTRDRRAHAGPGPGARGACASATSTGLVVGLGEITTQTYVDFQAIVRDTVRDIGYTRADYGFDYLTCGTLV